MEGWTESRLVFIGIWDRIGVWARGIAYEVGGNVIGVLILGLGFVSERRDVWRHEAGSIMRDGGMSSQLESIEIEDGMRLYIEDPWSSFE